MRLHQLFESRGVTAREVGQTYISNTDPTDVLTMQQIQALPTDNTQYDSVDELTAAIESFIPAGATTVDDNNKSTSTKAAVIALLTDANGEQQYHIRYIKSIPPQGVHGLWKTINGYKFSQGAAKESVPIKPSDLIADDNFRSTDQIATEVVSGATDVDAELGAIMNEAVKKARTGDTSPIKGAAKYFNVLQKYAGEYLGVLAIVDGGFKGGDTQAMLKALDISTLQGSSASFPQDTSMQLIDSVIKTADGLDIGVSSKIKTAGGAASSLSGVWKQMSDEIKTKYPQAAKFTEMLATESAVNGPLKVARELNIIDQADIQAMSDLDKTSQNIQDLGTARMRELTAAQGVASGTEDRPDYRVFYHALTAVTVKVIEALNNNEEFGQALKEALNNNQYVQVITAGKVQGDDATFDYFTKFPAVFEGKPTLVNKNYFATGQKGRLGFKLK